MTSCGTPSHAAPEVLRRSHYTKKADIYSFGITLWEICCRKEPYDSTPGFQVIVAVATKNRRPKLPPNLEPYWVNLIRRCWAENPDDRPDFEDLLDVFHKLILPLPTHPTPWREESLVKLSSCEDEESSVDLSRDSIPDTQIGQNYNSLSSSSDTITDSPRHNSPPLKIPNTSRKASLKQPSSLEYKNQYLAETPIIDRSYTNNQPTLAALLSSDPKFQEEHKLKPEILKSHSYNTRKNHIPHRPDRLISEFIKSDPNKLEKWADKETLIPKQEQGDSMHEKTSLLKHQKTNNKYYHSDIT